MTKTEAVIRSILGAVRGDIRPLVYAVDIAIELVFAKGVSMDDIFVTNDIYPEAAERLKKDFGAGASVEAVSRQIERLANKCWEALVERDLVTTYIGDELKDIHAPRDIIFYLAFYTYLDTPFFVAVKQRPTLLF